MIRAAGLLAGLMLLLAAAAADAAEARFEYGGTAAADQVHRLRLTGLPKGAVLAIAVETTTPARYLLLSETDLREWPAPGRPLFDEMVEHRRTFTARIVEPGNYFLLVDNRGKATEVDFRFEIHAAHNPK